MILTQHYLGCLSHASYLIGDETTGRAVVVDPRRDVGIYIDEAAARGLTIERVIETHVHADFVSGHLELAARLGATISYGAGVDVSFPIEPLADGQRLSLGDVTLEIMATPGHTPESICVVVYEHADDAVPYGVLTGDTLFVGDVGRPDLLASGGSELSADALGRRLYHSLHDRLLTLPDSTRVFPAHGAGSSCGKQLSSQTSSTIGEQRATNYALQPMDEDAFVDVVTEGQRDRPTYFEFDAARNREAHPLLDESAPPSIDLDAALARGEQGAVLLDVREPADFAAGHLRGAVNIGLQGRFAEWAGAVLPPERDIVLVGDPANAQEARVRLGRIGYDRVVATVADPGDSLARRPDLHETSSRVTIEQLAELRGLQSDLQVIDVRDHGETADGTLPGATEIPLGVLGSSLTAIDPDGGIVVYCASGYRSQIAASVLRAAGCTDVSDLLGGYGAWQAAGLPVADEGAAASPAVPAVGARAAAQLVAAGALLLDVREPDEWNAGHAAGAVHLPMGLVHDRHDDLPSDRRIVVVCRSGGRSAAVTQSLRGAGYDAVNLSGGMCAWSAAGLPVEAVVEDTGELVIHGRDPLNCETSLEALIGGVVMPNARFYVRNHFPTPDLDAASWHLDVHGLVERPLRLALQELHQMRSHTMVATLECAGNGRSTLDPPVPGEPWRLGAVSTAEWTGVPLVEVLDRAGPTADALEIVFRGADRGVAEGSPAPIAFERSLRLAEVATADALLAYAMNGEPLPLQHGRPLRLIVPGWYAVASVKWLTDIELVATPFDGFFQAARYHFEVEQDGVVHREPVRHQRVRSLVTEPHDGATATRGEVAIRGVAWSGDGPIEHVAVRVGDGPWQDARVLGEPAGKHWQWWELITRFDTAGPTTVAARATDTAGITQPDRSAWNRRGYGANGIHVVAVTVT